MKNDVEIKDRENEVEYLRMVLNICQVNIDYTHADLINRVTKALHKRKGSFTVNEGVELFYQWKQDWEVYFEKEKETETVNAESHE